MWVTQRFDNLSLALILDLVRNDPIANDFVLYNTRHCDVTKKDFSDGGLGLKYVANIKQLS